MCKNFKNMPLNNYMRTTMNAKTRTLIKVNLPKKDIYEGDQRKEIDELVMILMGKKPELRFSYLQENARFVTSLDV